MLGDECETSKRLSLIYRCFPVPRFPWLVLQEECLEKKFIVFADEIDLRAHSLQTHPNRQTQRSIQVSSHDAKDSRATR